jgi:hypothetical protein
MSSKTEGCAERATTGSGAISNFKRCMNTSEHQDLNLQSPRSIIVSHRHQNTHNIRKMLISPQSEVQSNETQVSGHCSLAGIERDSRYGGRWYLRKAKYNPMRRRYLDTALSLA